MTQTIEVNRRMWDDTLTSQYGGNAFVRATKFLVQLARGRERNAGGKVQSRLGMMGNVRNREWIDKSVGIAACRPAARCARGFSFGVCSAADAEARTGI